MYKVKLKSVILTLVLFVSLLLLTFNVYALTNELNKEANWNVKITDGTKDLTDSIQEIEFKVEDNPNVVKGRFAPGTTAKSEFNIDLVGTTYPVEIVLSIDDTQLPENVKTNVKIDDKDYLLNEVMVLEPNNECFNNQDGIKHVEIKLEWEDGLEDMSKIQDFMSIPINCAVKQHI